VLKVLLPTKVMASRDVDELMDPLIPRTIKFLRKAVELNDVIHRTCVSWDYVLFHPQVGQLFSVDTMEVDTEVHGDHPGVVAQNPTNNSQVLLATSLGLEAHRKVSQHGVFSQESTTVQKAKVVVVTC
jgi:hypothetical protein